MVPWQFRLVFMSGVIRPDRIAQPQISDLGDLVEGDTDFFRTRVLQAGGETGKDAFFFVLPRTDHEGEAESVGRPDSAS